MTSRTQSTQVLRWRRRASVLAASTLLLLLFVSPPSTSAQEGENNQAGLVVQFGDGQVYTACVDLGTDGQATSEEVLRTSGLAMTIDYNSGLGSTVCKIGSVGCNYPANPCFCQCTMKPGDPCVYWTHFHVQDGQWRYSIQSANGYVVRPGEVEGWAWGPGTAQAGTQPPLIPFEQICSAPPSAPLPAATQTLAPTATTVQATVTATATPTSTPLPSATSAPTVAPPTQAATETTTPTPPPSSTPVVEPTATATQTAPATQAAPTTAQQKVFVPLSAGEQQPSPAVASASFAVGEQEASGASGETGSYVVFGALVVVLVAGLAVLRIRQAR